MATSRRPRPLIALVVALAAASVALVAAPASAATAQTTTTLYAPNLIQANVPTTLIAQVTQDPAAGAPVGHRDLQHGLRSDPRHRDPAAHRRGASQATYAWTRRRRSSVPVAGDLHADGHGIGRVHEQHPEPADHHLARAGGPAIRAQS